MNREQIEGKLEQILGEIKVTWGRLTDDEIILFDGQEDEFYGRLKEKYGIEREAAEAHIKKFK